MQMRKRTEETGKERSQGNPRGHSSTHEVNIVGHACIGGEGSITDYVVKSRHKTLKQPSKFKLTSTSKFTNSLETGPMQSSATLCFNRGKTFEYSP